jgi:hypothetical protein
MYMYMWQEGGGVLADRCPDAQNICRVSGAPGRRVWEKLCLPITATCILPSLPVVYESQCSGESHQRHRT